MTSKIVSLEELCREAEKLWGRGLRLAATSGCFDILHAGHVAYLEKARAMADALAVLLNSDVSVRGLKGPERPIVPEDDRAAVLAGLSCVDWVCVFGSSTPCACYEALRPDIIVKGGDYRGRHIPEEETASSYGGRIEYVDFVEGRSSTHIIEKIKRLVTEGCV